MAAARSFWLWHPNAPECVLVALLRHTVQRGPAYPTNLELHPLQDLAVEEATSADTSSDDDAAVAAVDDVPAQDEEVDVSATQSVSQFGAACILHHAAGLPATITLLCGACP